MNDQPNNIDNDALRALETAFEHLTVIIGDDNARTAVIDVARLIVAAIVRERQLTDAKIEQNARLIAGIRNDVRDLVHAIADHKFDISGRVHTIANHVSAIEARIDELSQLIIMHFDSGNASSVNNAEDDNKRSE